MKIDNKKCKYDACKTLVQINGSICKFCRYKFCYTHILPETHGCGDEAKKHARAAWLAQNAPGANNTKPLKEDKRQYLQKKLQDKIEKGPSHQKHTTKKEKDNKK